VHEEGIENPERSTWDELAKRHGPGIVIDRSARPTNPIASNEPPSWNSTAVSREAAERSAGLS
jgi:hypothetical protein